MVRNGPSNVGGRFGNDDRGQERLNFLAFGFTDSLVVITAPLESLAVGFSPLLYAVMTPFKLYLSWTSNVVVLDSARHFS
jgi:hypothetical protein